MRSSAKPVPLSQLYPHHDERALAASGERNYEIASAHSHGSAVEFRWSRTVATRFAIGRVGRARRARALPSSVTVGGRDERRGGEREERGSEYGGGG